MSLFSLLKPTPFNLADALASWPEALVPQKYSGNTKKDGLASAWLARVAAACGTQKVPKSVWHEVALHFMSKSARKRMHDVENVMRCMSGAEWKWDWKSFGVAFEKIFASASSVLQ